MILCMILWFIDSFMMAFGGHGFITDYQALANAGIAETFFELVIFSIYWWYKGNKKKTDGTGKPKP